MLAVIIFKQFSNRPALEIYIREVSPRRKTAALGDRRDALCPVEALPAGPASRRCGRFLQSLHADEHLQRGRVQDGSLGLQGRRVAAATGGSSVDERAGGFYNGKALIAPTHSLSRFLSFFLLNFLLNKFFICTTSSYCPKVLPFFLSPLIQLIRG